MNTIRNRRTLIGALFLLCITNLNYVCRMPLNYIGRFFFVGLIMRETPIVMLTDEGIVLLNGDFNSLNQQSCKVELDAKIPKHCGKNYADITIKFRALVECPALTEAGKKQPPGAS